MSRNVKNNVSKNEASTQYSVPQTIEALKQWYKDRNLPAYQVTRFFIGENYTKPRAFGIYKDGDEFVVYKNKNDGSRAIRYRGRDEAIAVNEIYQKLCEEILRQKSDNVSRGKKGKKSVSSKPKSSLESILALALSCGLIFALGSFPTKRLWLMIVLFILGAVAAGVTYSKGRKKVEDTKRLSAICMLVFSVIWLIALTFLPFPFWIILLLEGLSGVFLYIRSKIEFTGKIAAAEAVMIAVILVAGFFSVQLANNVNKTDYYSYNGEEIVEYECQYFKNTGSNEYKKIVPPMNFLFHKDDYFVRSEKYTPTDGSSVPSDNPFAGSGYYFEDYVHVPIFSDSSRSGSSDDSYDWDSNDSWDSGGMDFDSDW